VGYIQALIDVEGLNTTLHAQELQAQLTLTRAMNCQDQFWREKARNQSFIFGDRNTTYFHRMARIKSSIKPITLLQDGAVRITNPTEMETHVVSYFQDIFGGNNHCISNGIVARVVPL